MKDGFVKIAAATPDIRVADAAHNAASIVSLARELAAKCVKVAVFPGLCVSGYTCGDLFLQKPLLDGCEAALLRIAAETEALDMIFAVGLPVRKGGCLYNCAAVIKGGEILGLVPKTHLPNYGEFYELRHFSPAPEGLSAVRMGGRSVPFGAKQLFVCESLPALKIGVELCEDLWAPDPPSTGLALAGATVALNRLRLRLRRRRLRRKHHRYGVLRPKSHRRKRRYPCRNRQSDAKRHGDRRYRPWSA